MTFDQTTRNRLQRFVTDVRTILTEEFTRQMQNDYGLDPHSGTVTPMEKLKHLPDSQRETARILRETLSHYTASTPDGDKHSALDRIVREQAFTVLNRLAALRLAETRGLLIESIGKIYQSKGFQLYARLFHNALGETGDAYRTYLFSLFDELAQELPALFDRYSPQGRLFPRETALLEVLHLMNDPEIELLWVEDETIGWIYQYFNSKEERKKMRDASQAPRNSRELAVRNQFFTPRYVVEFLVDNTLGRLWFNATGGQTALKDSCQYLLIKPDEHPEPATHLRDPRILKLLDPACGSMHFGLYAFDLFEVIYREAWAWEQQHGPLSLDTSAQPEHNLKPLSQTYTDENAFLADIPRLIIENNIYGVDIDPRAAQIASLALWLRAQRSWHEAGVKAKDRLLVGRGNVVAAIAPPTEEDLLKQFAAKLEHLDAELFEKTLQMLTGLPELGVLLRIESILPNLIKGIYGAHGELFKEADTNQWEKAEQRLRQALHDFAQEAKTTYQGRLFAYDALEGLRLMDLTREKFDVVVMNPPFGEFSVNYREYAKDSFSAKSHDILTAFVEVGLSQLRENGLLGAITSRTSFFAPTTRHWRENVILKNKIETWVDLGDGVLDDAMVETCLYTIKKANPASLSFFALTGEYSLSEIINKGNRCSDKVDNVFLLNQNIFSSVEGSPFSYWLEPELLRLGQNFKPLEKSGVNVRVGLQTGDDFRFIRCWWEVPQDVTCWFNHAKGGENEPYVTDIHLVVKWASEGFEMKAQPSVRLNMYTKNNPSQGLPAGLTFPYRTHRFSPAIMPEGTITGVAGMGIYSLKYDYFALMMILNSSVFNELINVRLALREINALYQAGVITPVPFPKLSDEDINKLEIIGRKIWSELSTKYWFNEVTSLFIGYVFNKDGLNQSAEHINSLWSSKRLNILKYFVEADSIIAKAYQIENTLAQEITKRNLPHFDKSIPIVLTNERTVAENLVSFTFCQLFGNPRTIKEIDENNVNPDKFILGEGARKCKFILFQNGKMCLSNEEVIIHLKKIFEDLFIRPDQSHEEFLTIIGNDSIEDYLSNPNGFFSAHLQQYSKSRRKAPIYWPLSTASGSFTLWLYYPKLSSQTLYTAVNDIVDPKLKLVNTEVTALRSKERSSQEEKTLDASQAFELELVEFRDTLLGIAKDYRPNHDDGVQITAAPLWPLFRHKPWQKVLKETWTKLEKGDYDWSHLARNYWPERVKEKCRTDKSLAIAHNLESFFKEPEAKPKKTSKRSKTQEEQEEKVSQP